MDKPQMGYVPTGWIDLGARDMTPVDIQPGSWQVNNIAQDGKNYVGMVARENNTWEGIGQVLNGVLQRDSTYTFSVWLAKAKVHMSPAILQNRALMNFKAPTILKVWGYNTATKAEELLGESQPIGNETWMQYSFEFTPRNGDYNELDLMVYYAPEHENENGHLLIDNCSAIVKVSK